MVLLQGLNQKMDATLAHHSARLDGLEGSHASLSVRVEDMDRRINEHLQNITDELAKIKSMPQSAGDADMQDVDGSVCSTRASATASAVIGRRTAVGGRATASSPPEGPSRPLVIGGWAYDTRKVQIEERVAAVLDTLPLEQRWKISSFGAPYARGTICLVHLKEDANSWPGVRSLLQAFKDCTGILASDATAGRLAQPPLWVALQKDADTRRKNRSLRDHYEALVKCWTEAGRNKEDVEVCWKSRKIYAADHTVYRVPFGQDS